MKPAMLDRRDFVVRLLADRGNLLVVGGLGSPTYDVAACGDHPLNFYIWSAMGSAAMVGLGLALARPDRRVAVITGDGEALMGVGSLATIVVASREYGTGAVSGARALATDLRRAQRRELIAHSRRALNHVLLPAAVGVLLPFLGVLMFPAVSALQRNLR